MSVSASVRMALKKASKHQVELGALWGSSRQSVSNKFRLERWSAEDLAQVAELTGAKLAFVYPDGQQILIQPDEAGEPEKKPEAPAKAKKAAPAKQKKPEASAKPKQKKAPAKEVKAPDVIEEQISFFE